MVNTNDLKRIFAAIILKPSPSDQWGTLGFVRGLWPDLNWEHLGPTQPVTQRQLLHWGAFKDTQPRSVFAYFIFRCCDLGGGEMKVLYSRAVLFLPLCPLIILTPFCTLCHAVEHENKKHPASSQPSVQTQVSEWVAPKTSVLSPASSLVLMSFFHRSLLSLYL